MYALPTVFILCKYRLGLVQSSYITTYATYIQDLLGVQRMGLWLHTKKV